MSANTGTLPIKGVKYRSMNQKNGVGKVPPKMPEGSKPSMPEFRRKFLETLRKRETERIQKEKVGKILFRKLAIKFGSDHKKLIRKYVLDFLAANEKITAALLVKLECDIAEAIRNGVRVGTSQPSAPEISSDDGGNMSKDASKGNIKLPPPGTEWDVLNVYQSIVHEERQQREKELAAVRKLKFKEMLDQQIKDAEALKQQLDKRDAQYHELIVEDVQNFEMSEKQRIQREKDKHHEELNARRRQIEDQKRIRELEKEKARRTEEETIRFAKEKAQIEKERIAAKKMHEMEVRKQIEMSNEANRARLRAEKERAVEEEHRMMKEYEAKLDREAFERDNAFKKRLEALEKIGANFVNTGAGKAAREEEIRFEMFLLNEAKKKEEAEAAELARKESERKAKEERARIENQRMLEWRQRIEALEKKQEEEMANKFRADVVAYQSEVQDEYRRKKERQVNYRLQLKEQQLDKLKQQAVVGVGMGAPMETRERELNMDLLTRAVEQVPDIYDRIPQRRPNSANAAAKIMSGGNLW